MNKQIIESLGFTEDLTFQLEDWIKPYLPNPNILSFIKFKSFDDNFNLYYNSSDEWNIILEITQRNNVFIFKIETIDELIVLLNQSGLAIYTNCLDLTTYSDFLLEYPEIITLELLKSLPIETVSTILIYNWNKIQLYCNFPPMVENFMCFEFEEDGIILNVGCFLTITELKKLLDNEYKEIEKINMDFEL